MRSKNSYSIYIFLQQAIFLFTFFLPRPCWNCIFSSSGSCLALMYPQCLRIKNGNECSHISVPLVCICQGLCLRDVFVSSQATLCTPSSFVSRSFPFSLLLRQAWRKKTNYSSSLSSACHFPTSL